MSTENCTNRMFNAYKELNYSGKKGFNTSNFLSNYCDIIDKCWTRNQYIKEMIIEHLESNEVMDYSRTVYYGTPFDTPPVSKTELDRRLKIKDRFIFTHKNLLKDELFRELGYYNYYSHTIGAMLHLNM